jgi:hypothetical protein
LRSGATGARLLRDCPNCLHSAISADLRLDAKTAPPVLNGLNEALCRDFPPRSGDGIEPSKRGVATPCRF